MELVKLFCNNPLDEERAEDKSRFKRRRCWVVDPLDDTRGYLAKQNTFGVIIGLLEDFQPVFGITYRPLSDELAFAIDGEGAFVEIGREQNRISVQQGKISVLISNSRSSEELEKILQKIKPEETIKIGGSLKTVEVAKGNASLFLCPTTSVMHLWDLCAPQVILEEAGGRISNAYGKCFDYSQAETVNRNGVIASNGIIHQRVVGAYMSILS